HPVSMDVLADVVKRRAGSVAPYAVPATDFDVAFITPVNVYAAQQRPAAGRLMDFANWSDYVSEVPPVLLVRATPQMVESFWTTVARGAAMTQGAALPPIKHVKSGFQRMRVLCGDAEVTPIHALTIEQRVSETEAINEGLYVFDPSALGSQCKTVKVVLYSEKA